MILTFIARKNVKFMKKNQLFGVFLAFFIMYFSTAPAQGAKTPEMFALHFITKFVMTVT